MNSNKLCIKPAAYKKEEVVMEKHKVLYFADVETAKNQKTEYNSCFCDARVKLDVKLA